MRVLNAVVGRRRALSRTCNGHGDCPNWGSHHPACLARYRTEREITARIQVRDRVLQARRDLINSATGRDILRAYRQGGEGS